MKGKDKDKSKDQKRNKRIKTWIKSSTSHGQGPNKDKR